MLFRASRTSSASVLQWPLGSVRDSAGGSRQGEEKSEDEGELEKREVGDGLEKREDEEEDVGMSVEAERRLLDT